MLSRALLLGLIAAALLPASAHALSVGQCLHQAGSFGCVNTRGTEATESAVVSPDGRHVYAVAGSGDYGALSAFARDTRTGRLRQLPGKAGCISATGVDHEEVGGPKACAVGRQLAFLEDIAISADGRTIYTVAGGGSEHRHGIAVFRRDPATGRVTQEQCFTPNDGVRGCPQSEFRGPSAIAIAPGGRTLIVGGEALATFPLGEDGLVSGPATCHVLVYLYDPEDTGACTSAPRTSRIYPIARMAASASDGRLYAIGVDDYGSQVQSFALDPATGAPSFTGCAGPPPCATRARALHEAEDLAVAPGGKAVYTAASRFLITEERNIEGVTTTSSVGVFIPTATGLAQPAGSRGCVLFAGKAANPGCGAARPPFLSASAITLTPDGRSAVAGFGSTGAVVLLRRNPATQALTPVRGRAGCLVDRPAAPAFARACATGRGIGYPNDIALSPDGRHAYVVHQDGLAVVALR